MYLKDLFEMVLILLSINESFAQLVRRVKMIKFINFSPKLLAIASYYTQILVQFDKFSLFFLSPHSYAKLSKLKLK